jgi:hypothetical protein
MSRRQAISAVVREQPELQQAYLEAGNSSRFEARANYLEQRNRRIAAARQDAR